MKRNILTFKYILILLLLSEICAHAQSNVQGRINYICKINLEKDSLNMDSKSEKKYNFLLFFNSQKAIGKECINKIYENKNKSVNLSKQDTNLFYRKNNSKKLIFTNYTNKKYLINDEFTIKWKITNKTKKIGNFICNEALTTFRGREYTAYFTTKIPVSYGPWKFYGLPGLILSIYDKEKKVQFIFESLKIDNTQNFKINEPKKGIKINYKNYHKLLFKQIKNASKFFASRLGNMNSVEDVKLSKIYSIEK